MAYTSRADALLARRGEQINIYRRTLAGVDEYNRPKYTWSLLYTVGIFVRMDLIKQDEVIYYEGERIQAEYKCFFQSDEDILKDDQPLWNSQRWEILGIQQKKDRTFSKFKVAYLKRLIE